VDFVTVTGFRGFREFRFLGRPFGAIKSRILYSRILPVVPHFSPAFSFPLFTRCHSRIPHCRFLPIADSVQGLPSKLKIHAEC